MKTIKLITAIIIAVVHTQFAFSQGKKDSSSISKNTIYFELFGNGGVYSVNYDRILLSKEKFKISARLGFSFLPAPARSTAHALKSDITGYPLEINFLFGNKSFMELGIGPSLIRGFHNGYDNNDKTIISYGLYLVPRVGYRYQRAGGGFFMRVGLTPLIKIYEFNKKFNDSVKAVSDSQRSQLWFGLGIGYTFKK